MKKQMFWGGIATVAVFAITCLLFQPGLSGWALAAEGLAIGIFVPVAYLVEYGMFEYARRDVKVGVALIVILMPLVRTATLHNPQWWLLVIAIGVGLVVGLVIVGLICLLSGGWVISEGNGDRSALG